MSDDNNNRSAKRCTILIDNEVYKKAKMAASDIGDSGIRLYQFINNVLAKAVGVDLPYSLKHPSTKKKKPKADTAVENTPNTIPTEEEKSI